MEDECRITFGYFDRNSTVAEILRYFIGVTPIPSSQESKLLVRSPPVYGPSIP